MRLSVIGLGKLGCPLAACLAAAGHDVIGVDANATAVQQVNDGKSPVSEPGVEQLLEQTPARLKATTDIGQAVAATDITFILVPTPSKQNGAFSLKHVQPVVKAIGQALRNKDTYHVVVVTSTVMPGDTGNSVRPLLEEFSGKSCPTDFGVCYNPEFVALGSVIHDLRNPDFLLIGESDPRAGDRLATVYESLCPPSIPVVRTSWVNAELAKLAVNTFVTTKISYANMLAEICERIDGGDVDAVTTAIGHDSRIGSRYLKAGLGYGGPCFPRDNAALAALASGLGLRGTLPRATDAVNRRQVLRLHRLVKDRLPHRGSVAILGLAYKLGTSVTENAQGLQLAERLLTAGTPVVVYDPSAMSAVKSLLSGQVRFAESTADCIRDADVIVVCAPCEEFRTIGPHLVPRNEFQRPTVIDCWRILARGAVSAVADYVALGLFDPPVKRARRTKRRTARRN